MKKLLSIFAVACFALILWAQNIVPVAAAEPTTYILKYDDEDDEWYYKLGSSWDNSTSPQQRELYYLLQEIKDGDYVVVDSTSGIGTLVLDFTLGNLTILPNSSALITCKGILEYYQLRDSSVSLTANVEKAFIYDNAITNFNKNTNSLELIYSESPEMSIVVVGTCEELWVHNFENTVTACSLWNFTDKLVFNDGVIKTAPGSYAINPPSAPAAPIVSTTPSSTPTATPSAPSSSADEYDDVPKTGESAAFLWMFALAALCFAGSYSFKKKF
jgi:hypothetical protein